MGRQVDAVMHCDVRSENGSAVVLGIAIILGLVSLLMVMSSIGGWLLAQTHAASVADVAALAAATEGSCAAALEAAHVNGSQLLECRWEGSDVIVVVSSPVRNAPVVTPMADVHASARAGF